MTSTKCKSSSVDPIKVVNGMQLPPPTLLEEDRPSKKPRLDIENVKSPPPPIFNKSITSVVSCIPPGVTVTPKTNNNNGLTTSVTKATSLENTKKVLNKSNDTSYTALHKKITTSGAVSLSPKILNKSHDEEEDLLREDYLFRDCASPKSDVSLSLEEALLNGGDISDTDALSDLENDNKKGSENISDKIDLDKKNTSNGDEKKTDNLIQNYIMKSGKNEIKVKKMVSTKIDSIIKDISAEIKTTSKEFKEIKKQVNERKADSDNGKLTEESKKISNNKSIRHESVKSTDKECTSSNEQRESSSSSTNTPDEKSNESQSTKSCTNVLGDGNTTTAISQTLVEKSTEEAKCTNSSTKEKKINLKSNGSISDAKSMLTFKEALQSLQKEDSIGLYNSKNVTPLKPVQIADIESPSKTFTLTVLEPPVNQGVKRSIHEEQKMELKKSRITNNKYKSAKKSTSSPITSITTPPTISEYQISDLELARKTMTELDSSKISRTAKKLKRITRKDLEDLVLDLFINKVLYEHELGAQRDLSKRLEATLESSRKKAVQCRKEIEDLKKVTQRLIAEHTARKGQIVTPVKVKRSVGIQATPNIISKGLVNAITPTSLPKAILPPRTNVINTSPKMMQQIVPAQTTLQQTNNTNAKVYTATSGGRLLTAMSPTAQPTPVPSMVMINNSQLVPVTQPQNGGASSFSPLPIGTRLVPAPAAPIKPTNPITSNLNKSITLAPKSNSSFIDLTDDDDISNTNRSMPLLVQQRNSSGVSNQFVALPQASVGQQILLLPSNGGQTGTALMVSNMPGKSQTTGQSVQSFIPVNATKVITPSNRILLESAPMKVSGHPAPLPITPIQQTAGLSKMLPPVPLLKLSHKNNSIVLSWNMTKTEEHEAISSYQLYAYQEGSTPPTQSLWKKVGSVKALELPMACTLTQFMPGHVYHFAVRAVDTKNRLGPFSIPRSIRLVQ